MKKHAFGLAVATALAFGGVAVPANAATIDEGDTWSSLTAYWNSIASNWWTQAGNTIVGTFTKVSTTTFAGGYASVVETVYDWSLQIGQNGNIYSAFGTSVATGATGYISINGVKQDASEGPASYDTSPFETISGSYVAAVPGPVAAAGLPAALAGLVGFGLYRRRTRAAA